MHVPHGISEGFLRVARREQAAGRRAILAAIVAGLAVLFLAELADPEPQGAAVRTFLACVAAGLAAGFALSRWRLRSYESALRARWRHWMSAAGGCASLSEIARRADEREPRSPAAAALPYAALVIANVSLFGLLWADVPGAETAALPLLAVNGLAVGAHVAGAAMTMRWCREFVRAADELVADGTVGLYGER
ncbi:MAG TPA: hypothetical protein VM681_00460 [Candidatus Thermoplasmatota archaeon]|nr:hypothetical protein [Candidatus Thermoplasmatota archaeon]